ncbi:lysylphosphatidylglycerol synthase transmembrane domain-containing protein [Lichenihabitans psoromatis]|uniref:lysylphosphatidylglycerol synthase transmembrane domain-containing protein n=1 Tax=Lichenihabitans psoromatis TaxID=2528642 RepID=UPI0010384035|nr:YbhN family protein [Lichenihabitans psoromatis]
MIGVAAVVFSLWLLFREVRGLSFTDVEASILAISSGRWMLAILSTLVAYMALAWYDRIALSHLGFKLPWGFISAVSFTTYALSHNIGMSMFSGAMVRYRAYSTKGLTLSEVGVLVAFCSFTFALGTALLGGLVFVIEPNILARLFHLSDTSVRLIGCGLLAFVALYVIGSALNLRPLQIGTFKLVYPRLNITMRQLIAGPLELLGAAGIIYCALPVTDNPGFLIILGVFLASFSAALLSHAPGGLGVLELVFVTALPDIAKADILAALLVFRLLYLIAPLAFGIIAVILFERSRLAKATDPKAAG